MNVNPGKTHFKEAEHVALRGEVKAKVKALGISQAELARQSDVPDSTLSQYLNDRYPAEPGKSEVASKLTKWLRAQETAEAMRRTLPDTPPFISMHGSAEIMGTLSYARATGSLVVIAGAPGVSKTATCKQYVSDTPRAWYAAMDPTTSGVPTMLLEVLAAMGLPDAKGTPQVLKREVVRVAEEATGLLVIDEGQHLTLTAIEALRAINDRCGLGIAIVGNEELYTKVGATGGKREFAQVSSRVAHRVVRLHPDPRDAEMLAMAWAAANREEIGKPEVGFCQSIASKPGGLRNVSQTFRKAVFAARVAGEALDLSHLQGAFAQLSGGVQVR